MASALGRRATGERRAPSRSAVDPRRHSRIPLGGANASANGSVGTVCPERAIRAERLYDPREGAMRDVIRAIAIVLVLIGPSATAQADPVIIANWNAKVMAAGLQARQAPFVHTRSVAIVHLAMFEAVNAIERRYTPYCFSSAAAAGTSREVAAATAAYRVLIRLYPDQAPDFDSLYQHVLSVLPDGTPKSEGIRVGERAATEILTLRAKDGADAPNTYRPFTATGTYVPTVLPASFTWARVTPFALKEASQFRPAAPVSLTSARWAQDFNEVKRLGARVNAERTPEQTEIARLWE